VTEPAAAIPATLPALRATLAADLARNAAGFQRLTVVIFRVGQYAAASRSWMAKPLRALWLVADRLYLRMLLGTELPPNVPCGPGLALPHAGRGVVIHPNASIGSNCMIFHHVTLGTHRTQEAPRIADVVPGSSVAARSDVLSTQ
jgi:serine O-acetyltransferase